MSGAGGISPRAARARGGGRASSPRTGPPPRSRSSVRMVGDGHGGVQGDRRTRRAVADRARARDPRSDRRRCHQPRDRRRRCICRPTRSRSTRARCIASWARATAPMRSSAHSVSGLHRLTAASSPERHGITPHLGGSARRPGAGSRAGGRTVCAVSNGSIAGLFPGQGSQHGDLRERVERVVPGAVRALHRARGRGSASRACGESTRFAQPAIFCASIAGWMRAREHGCARSRSAGHSLGELSALVAAGALDPPSGLELAVRRGELMAAADTRARRKGCSRVLGAAEDQLTRARRGARRSWSPTTTRPARSCSPGRVDAPARRPPRGHASAGVRAIMLDVAGAFHSPAMSARGRAVPGGARRRRVSPARDPGDLGLDARPFADVRAELAAAIVRPVRWRETMVALARLGADTFVDFGPGQVLARLVRRNLPDARRPRPDALLAIEPLESSGVA